MSYKCKNCGRSYEENGLKDLANTFTGKNWISQKGFCSDRCKVEYENNHNEGPKLSNSEASYSTGANQSSFERAKTSDEILAEAEVKKMKREEKALQPWKFASNFESMENISKITFPDTPDDIEKTILKIIKTAIDQIKIVLNESYSEYQQRIAGNQKAMWSPYNDEILFVENCIEKSIDGIRKLDRFDSSVSYAMINECNHHLSVLKNDWFIQLKQKKDKKKKTLKIMIVVVITLLAAMMIGLSIAA